MITTQPTTIPSNTVCFGMPYSSQMILLSGNSLLLPRSGLLRRGGRGRDGWERPETQAAGERWAVFWQVFYFHFSGRGGPSSTAPRTVQVDLRFFFRKIGGGEWNTNRDLRRPSQFQRLDSETGGGGRHNSILKVALQIFFCSNDIFVLLVNIFIIKQLWRDRQVAALLRDCLDSLGRSHIFLEVQSKPSKCRRTLQKRPSSACGAVLVGAKPLNCGEQLVFGRTRFSTTSPPRAWTAARPGSDLVPHFLILLSHFLSEAENLSSS